MALSLSEIEYITELAARGELIKHENPKPQENEADASWILPAIIFGSCFGGGN